MITRDRTPMVFESNVILLVTLTGTHELKAIPVFESNVILLVTLTVRNEHPIPNLFESNVILLVTLTFTVRVREANSLRVMLSY